MTTTVKLIINKTNVRIIMPIMKDTAESTAFNIPAASGCDKTSAADEHTDADIRHNSNSMIRGRIMSATAIIPYTQTDDLNKFIHPLTVESASLTAFPTTGTVVPTINFAVFAERFSDALEIDVWILNTPSNTVDARPRNQFDIFFIVLIIESVEISGMRAPPIPSES